MDSTGEANATVDVEQTNTLVGALSQDPVPAAEPGDTTVAPMQYQVVQNVATFEDLVVYIIQDVNAFWGTALPAAGYTWTPPSYQLAGPGEPYPLVGCTRPNDAVMYVADPAEFTGGVTPAAYSPTDNTIYLSLQWLYDRALLPHINGFPQERMNAFLVGYHTGHGERVHHLVADGRTCSLVEVREQRDQRKLVGSAHTLK